MMNFRHHIRHQTKSAPERQLRLL